MSTPCKNYLIIGAGAFGASTARHLALTTNAKITLVDRHAHPDPRAASTDLNKVIRADYLDFFHTKLAQKACDTWKTDPLFKPFYHEAGLLVCYPGEHDPSVMLEHYRRLGVQSKSETLTAEDLKTRFNARYADAEYENRKFMHYNPDSGWAEAAAALKAVLDDAIANGVEYVIAETDRLVLDENRECTGAVIKDSKGSRTLTADRIILTSGAGTAEILASTASGNCELQAGNRLIATGYCIAVYDLDSEQQKWYKDAPSFALMTPETKLLLLPLTELNR